MGCLEKIREIKEIPQTFFTNEENEKIPMTGEIDVNQIPNDQFLCPKCKRIPEVLNIHFEEGYIYFRCKNHGIIPISISNYYKTIKDSPFNYFHRVCSEQNCINKQGIQKNMKYCYECQQDLCEKCIERHDNKQHHTIDINNKNNICLKHYREEIQFFCEDCEENICNEEKKTRHKDHKMVDLSDLYEEAVEYKKIILEKNKTICDALKLMQIILNTFEKFPRNYFHLKSVINIGKAMGERIKEQKEAIKSLQENYRIDLNGYEQKVNLWNRKLDDEGLKLVSKIRFKKLKSLDLSCNEITNIKCLYRMNLPFLEYIDLSNNHINDIEPLAELNCPELKEICLQNNEIEDISPFMKSNFPKLERLRVDSNHIDYSSFNFKEIQNAYQNKLYYIPKTVKDFNEEYNCKINEHIEDEKAIIISDLINKNGNKILEDLYLIIPKGNKIKKLSLANTGITDISMLTRIPLYHLKELNLSVNQITNLKFLNEMKLPNLNILFLDNNRINDVTYLIKFIESSDKKEEQIIISLKNNNFISKIGDNIKFELDNESEKSLKEFIKTKKIVVDLNPYTTEENLDNLLVSC